MSVGLRSSLVRLSGADPDLLRWAPKEESVAFEALGGVILGASTIAATGMFFGLSLGGLSPWFAAPLSVLWFFLILSLDRWLVVSLQRSGHRLQTMLLALPRLILSIMNGVLVSTPLVLEIFHADIAAELKSKGIGTPAGLLDQLTALNELAARNNTINVARLLLFFLLTAVVSLPVLIQILRLYAPASVYDRLVADRSLEDRAQAVMQIIQTRRSMTESEQEYAQGLADLLNSLGPPPDEDKRTTKSTAAGEEGVEGA